MANLCILSLLVVLTAISIQIYKQNNLLKEKIDKLANDHNEKLKDINESIQIINSTIIEISNQVNSLNENFIKKLIRYSLRYDISIEDMKSQGYEIVYDFLYPHVTTFAELSTIKSKCTPESILCAGGAAVGSDQLLLVSCGKCQSILRPTQINQPVLDNGAYWYLTDKYSFGFSSSNNIKQNFVDCYDCDGSFKNCKDNNRLSWRLDGGKGWRLGKLTGYDPGMHWFANYRKILLLF